MHQHKHQPIVNQSRVVDRGGGSEHSKLELFQEAATFPSAETNANGTTATDIDTITIPTQSWKQ